MAMTMPKQPAKLLNQPSPLSTPGNEELKNKWPQYVDAARIAWGEVAEDELLKIERPAQQLAELIHTHYSAVTREEADIQVKWFFAKHHF